MFDSALDSLMAFAHDGKRTFRDFASDVLRSIASISGQLALSGIKDKLGLNFNNGADFVVGGKPGIDQNPVAFNATKGERVTVTPKGQAGPGAVPSVAQPNVIVKIVNILDPSVVQDAMNGEEGEQITINHITRNPQAVSQALS